MGIFFVWLGFDFGVGLFFFSHKFVPVWRILIKIT